MSSPLSKSEFISVHLDFLLDSFSLAQTYKSYALREKCPYTEFFLVRIQSECGKMRTRKNSVFGHTSHSDALLHNSKKIITCQQN